MILQIKGCYEFNISSDDIQLGDVGYSWYGTLQIAAKVTEQASGKTNHMSHYLLNNFIK